MTRRRAQPFDALRAGGYALLSEPSLGSPRSACCAGPPAKADELEPGRPDRGRATPATATVFCFDRRRTGAHGRDAPATWHGRPAHVRGNARQNKRPCGYRWAVKSLLCLAAGLREPRRPAWIYLPTTTGRRPAPAFRPSTSRPSSTPSSSPPSRRNRGRCSCWPAPGSGKTRTLTYRVAWLLSQGVKPAEILLLTFTNKAAKEMLHRVHDLTGVEPGGSGAARFTASATARSACTARPSALPRNFTILDADESDRASCATRRGNRQGRSSRTRPTRAPAAARDDLARRNTQLIPTRSWRRTSRSTPS
jgi:hypothetical protein